VTRSPSLTRTTASSRCSSRTGRRGEGGEADDLGRYDALTTALTHDAVAAVDIELAALRGNAPEGEESHATALRNTARETDVAVVVSVHDFESTPEPAALVDLLADAAAEGDVGKLATTAAASEDALAMIEATHEATAAGHRVATMCMGEPGRHTRAVTPCTARKSATRPSIPRTQRRPASTRSRRSEDSSTDCAATTLANESLINPERRRRPLINRQRWRAGERPTGANRPRGTRAPGATRRVTDEAGEA